MKLYQVTVLTVPVGTTPQALPRIQEHEATVQRAGRLLACWYAEIGVLNRIMLIHSYDGEAARAADHVRLLETGNPYGIGDLVSAMQVDTYAPFPFLPNVEPGEAGPFYEVRVYGLKPDGLAPTIEAWHRAVGPRTELSPLTVAMYALDGAAPRFMNIWPYRSLDARQHARNAAVQQGIWPPKGGPAHLTTLESGIWLPAAFSPLR